MPPPGPDAQRRAPRGAGRRTRRAGSPGPPSRAASSTSVRRGRRGRGRRSGRLPRRAGSRPPRARTANRSRLRVLEAAPPPGASPCLLSGTLAAADRRTARPESRGEVPAPRGLPAPRDPPLLATRIHAPAGRRRSRVRGSRRGPVWGGRLVNQAAHDEYLNQV